MRVVIVKMLVEMFSPSIPIINIREREEENIKIYVKRVKRVKVIINTICSASKSINLNALSHSPTIIARFAKNSHILV